MLDVVIGSDVVSGEQVCLRYDDRPLGLAIIGKTGTGKSSVLERLIVADLQNGTAGVAIDPHGLLAQRVISLAPPETRERLVLVESSRAAPFGLNLLACREPVDEYDEPDVWAASSVVQALKKLYGEADSFQPRFERYLGLAARTLIAADRTLIDATRLFHDDGFRNRCMSHTSDRALREWLRGKWVEFERLRFAEQAVHTEAVVNRLERLLEPRAMQYMLGSRRTTIPFDTVLSGDTFIILSLPSERLGEEWCDYIGSMFLCTLADRIFARRAFPQPPRVHIYLDEYQRFKTDTTKKFFTEGRKYNVGIALAHQTRGQIRDVRESDAELQCRNLVILAVTRRDADVLAGELPVVQREEWIEQIELEDGTEPVLVPTRSPVEHLYSGGGHRNRRVVDAARTLFVETQGSQPKSYLEELYPLHVPSENTRLNQLLVDVMDGTIRSKSEFSERLVVVLFSLARGNKKPPVPPYQYAPQDEHAHVLAPGYVERGYSHRFEVTYESWPDYPKTIQETVSKELRRWVDAYVDQKNAFIEKSRDIDTLLQRLDKELLDFAWTFGNDVISTLPNSYHCSRRCEAYEMPRLKHMVGIYREQLRCLLILCDGLAEDPILVPSGQERQRRRTQVIVHPWQSEQDARNELAARLVNPGEGHVAHVKLPRSYREVRLLPPYELDGTGQDIDEVRQRSRELYAMREGDFFADDGESPSSIGRRT